MEQETYPRYDSLRQMTDHDDDLYRKLNKAERCQWQFLYFRNIQNMKEDLSLSDFIRQNCFAQQDHNVVKLTEKLLSSYLEYLNSTENNSISDEVVNINNSIKKCYDCYLNARIDEAIATMKGLIECHKNDLLHYDILNEGEHTDWYRARHLKDCRYYTHEEMFHIPFEKRRKVENQRYSINGYPCLYLGRTIYACWIEMGEPALTDFAISRFKATETIKLLDLRLHKESEFEENETMFEQYLKTLPLIIACSIKVKEQNSPFKPEYIIPQLIMLAISQKNNGFQGVAYTSVQLNDRAKWPDYVYENIAIPVRSSADKGHCKKIKQWFECSDSTTYEQEMVRADMHNKDDGSFDDTNKDYYKESIFSQLEGRFLSDFELQQIQ